jgi:hypothetical protein
MTGPWWPKVISDVAAAADAVGIRGVAVDPRDVHPPCLLAQVDRLHTTTSCTVEADIVLWAVAPAPDADMWLWNLAAPLLARFGGEVEADVWGDYPAARTTLTRRTELS